MKKILFVSGVARSGTSALVHLLNTHPKCLIGMERYYNIIEDGSLDKEHFSRERFVEVQPGDTHGYGNEVGFEIKDLEARRQAYDRATVVGDKYPNLFQYFDLIFRRFPEAQHIYICRNPLSVIESFNARAADPKDSWPHDFQAGLDYWNESIRRVNCLPEEFVKNFIFVQYEELFSSVTAIDALFNRLGLEPTEPSKANFYVDQFAGLNQQKVFRDDRLRTFVSQNADWAAYSAVLRRCDILMRPSS